MSINSFAQKRIEREQLAVIVVQLLYRESGLSWTPANIAKYANASKEKIADCFVWMRRKNLIGGTDKIFLTDSGVEYVQGLKENVSVSTAASEQRYKDEALTGIVEKKHKAHGWMVSEQSGITAAVLPGSHTPTTHTTPEDMIEQAQREYRAKEGLSNRLRVSMDTLLGYIDSGRVKLCNACNSVEIFDRKGDRWQPVCRKCRKKKRG